MGLMLITHNLVVFSEYADRVLVMYGRQIIEHAETKELLREKKHPYTEGLVASIPNMEEDVERLGIIQGVVPPAYLFPKGCRFSDRCPYVMEICLVENPILI